MVKSKFRTRKKLKRATEREIRIIPKAKGIGMTTREIGRAFEMTHPAIVYILHNKLVKK